MSEQDEVWNKDSGDGENIHNKNESRMMAEQLEDAEGETQERGQLQQEKDLEEKKKCRCQRKKKEKYNSEEAMRRLKHQENEVEGDQEEEEVKEDNDDDVDVEEDENENLEDEEETSISEYSSILSAISFEWEDKNFEFIDLCDPGTMDNIYIREKQKHEYDFYGKTCYLEYCDKMKIPPIVRFYNSLNTNISDLTFHSIRDKQMKAISAALEQNHIVKTLILKGNTLSGGCCSSLSALLSKNSTITCLDLSTCRIGPEGTALLANGLKGNESLKELNLSKCYIEDEGMKYLVHPLKQNYFLEKLILSYNNLGEGAAEALATILYSNNCIHCINLDYNNMFDSASMKKFFKGLGFNTALTHISLKWNAMSAVDIGDAIAQFLRKNKTVKNLDLSDNRFDSQSVRPLQKGIAKSESLEVLRLARNPIFSQDVEYLLSGVKVSPRLNLLDLEDIWVRKEFIKALKKVQLVKEVNVTVGGVYSDYSVQGPDYAAVILKRARFEAMKPKKKTAQRDFGHLMFMLGDDPLTEDEFVTLLKKFKAIISNELCLELIKQFTIPKVNKIDVIALRKKYLSIFPDSKPQEQKKLKKDEKNEEEDFLKQGEYATEEDETNDASEEQEIIIAHNDHLAENQNN